MLSRLCSTINWVGSMSDASPDNRSAGILPASPQEIGGSVRHPELGDGILLGIEDGYARAFFREHGERQVPTSSLLRALSWEEEVVAHLEPATAQALRRLWLAMEAVQLPLMESAAALTAAKVDLLPHQIVLTHRVADSSPRRFLVADEVGLGKTIETALVLRELASRGEMTRALMIVPAGLVENWRRELNETFHLDFEVFGPQGDVTDRRTNIFARHHRLIASIDTLKRPARIRRLLDAPRWDLIVFDEAHHLTATRNGNKVQKTQNFKLAEQLREHTRDLMLLSAAPHQGNHFRFWMLIRLLNSRLFTNAEDMLENRHRLDSLVIRRTKAEVCAADGSTIFARRQVHSQCFNLTQPEKVFYDAMLEYLADGYDLAARQGKEGKALGFVMTIFQKIAASSFAAVRSTLRRRLLMLTIHEALVRDEQLDVDGRDRAYQEARALIHHIYGIADDLLGRVQVDRLLADARMQLLKRLKECEEVQTESGGDSEWSAAQGEETAAVWVSVALPEERSRIIQLLQQFPSGRETKTQELLAALGQLWHEDPTEKVVIFTTYLGSVDSLRTEIDKEFPQAGVEVLKGGDHGAKIAAERRFKRPSGPRVLICTAAGREGINLQFARVLFNHDLPWNPMDVEQRIGRIHRYGQKDNAQVYNLVATDTIEGSIYLLLEQKIKDIAKALGKVDERGEVAEDLRGQILGQLSERLCYDRLYRDALQDPALRRTRLEIESALENAKKAREVVFELFQDLQGFNLDQYRAVDDQGQGMRRLLNFAQLAAVEFGGSLTQTNGDLCDLKLPDGQRSLFTTNRDEAIDNEEVDLLGLEHPAIRHLLDQAASLPATERALSVFSPTPAPPGILTLWKVEIHGTGGEFRQLVCPIGITSEGQRNAAIERLASRLDSLLAESPATPLDINRTQLIRNTLPDLLRRELYHRGSLTDTAASYSSRLLVWVEVS